MHVVQTSGYNPDVATGVTVRMIVTDSRNREDIAKESEIVLREGDGACLVSSIDSRMTFKNEGDRDAELFVLRVS